MQMICSSVLQECMGVHEMGMAENWPFTLDMKIKLKQEMNPYVHA